MPHSLSVIRIARRLQIPQNVPLVLARAEPGYPAGVSKPPLRLQAKVVVVAAGACSNSGERRRLHTGRSSLDARGSRYTRVRRYVSGIYRSEDNRFYLLQSFKGKQYFFWIVINKGILKVAAVLMYQLFPVFVTGLAMETRTKRVHA